MKISSLNNSLFFSKTSQTQHNNQANHNNTNSFTYSNAAINAIKAYGLQSVNFGKCIEHPIETGIENAIIKPSYDTYELIYKIKSPYPDTDKVGIAYKLPRDKENRFAISGPKSLNNDFSIKIPILKRDTNTIVDKINIYNVGYIDSANKLVGEENFKYDPINIKVQDVFDNKIKKTTQINGNEKNIMFDNISEGVSEGKLTPMDYSDLLRYQGSEPIVGYLEDKDMEALFLDLPSGNFALPDKVTGVIAATSFYTPNSPLTDALGHAVCRMRGRKTFLIAPPQLGDELKNKILTQENPLVRIKLDQEKLTIDKIDSITPADTSKVKVPKYSLVSKVLSPDDKEFTASAVGLKAFNLGKLQQMQKQGGFKVPNFVVVPAGLLNTVKHHPENANTYGEPDYSSIETLGAYHFNVEKADNSSNPTPALKTLRHLIVEDMYIPKDLREDIKTIVENKVGKLNNPKGNGCLIARSSFNGEDSDVYATQGLYDSFPGIRTYEDLFRGIKQVWASKWSNLAYWSRRNHGIEHSAIQPNVIVQNVVPVDYTFTINTADPRSNDKNKIVIQLSQGVYSGFPNSPYIFEYDKTTGNIKRTALATKARMKNIEKVIMNDDNNFHWLPADYSKDPLNKGKREYSPIIKQIMDVAKFIEANMDGKPQDIEGGIKFIKNEQTGQLEPEIHIWQTRDVHLIKR